MPVREYSGSAKATTLSGSVTAAATVINVVDATGWPTGSVGPFVITLDAGVTTEEKVLVSGRTGNSLTVSARGFDGTTASDHGNAARVEHTLSATDIREANAHVNDTSGDPHPQYLTPAEGAALYPTLNHGHAYSNLDHSHTYESITLKPAPVQALLGVAAFTYTFQTASDFVLVPAGAVTFTAPASGKVLIRLGGLVRASTNPQSVVPYAVVGTTTLGDYSQTPIVSNGGAWLNAPLIATGLTAGTSVTATPRFFISAAGPVTWQGVLEVWTAP